MRTIGRLLPVLACSAALGLASGPSHAQLDKSQSIRIVVGFAPGGGIDAIARLVAQKTTASLAVPVVVENLAGASGNIAAVNVSKSPPNGRSLLFTSSAHAMNPALDPSTPFHPVRDFSPVTQSSRGFSIMVVHPSLGVTNLKQFLDLARSKPGTIFYGSGGIGTVSHMATELMKSFAKVDVTHVPYKGAGPYNAAMLAGQIQLSITSISNVQAHFKTGRLVPLAVTTLQRSEMLPNVPTADEAGIPGYEYTTWQGFLGPPKMAPELVNRLREHIAAALKAPDMRPRLESDGYTPVGGTPEEFTALIQKELVTWTALVKERGIRPQ